MKLDSNNNSNLPIDCLACPSRQVRCNLTNDISDICNITGGDIENMLGRNSDCPLEEMLRANPAHTRYVAGTSNSTSIDISLEEVQEAAKQEAYKEQEAKQEAIAIANLDNYVNSYSKQELTASLLANIPELYQPIVLAMIYDAMYIAKEEAKLEAIEAIYRYCKY